MLGSMVQLAMAPVDTDLNSWHVLISEYAPRGCSLMFAVVCKYMYFNTNHENEHLLCQAQVGARNRYTWGELLETLACCMQGFGLLTVSASYAQRDHDQTDAVSHCFANYVCVGVSVIIAATSCMQLARTAAFSSAANSPSPSRISQHLLARTFMIGCVWILRLLTKDSAVLLFCTSLCIIAVLLFEQQANIDLNPAHHPHPPMDSEYVNVDFDQGDYKNYEEQPQQQQHNEPR
jgi:hypothetical protein